MELKNCVSCGNVFVDPVREICRKCYREEEEAFKKVYRFLSNRKNREATISEIVAATHVEEDLIIKFLKQKRLRSSQFPKLAYPCESCGVDIVEGRLCTQCSSKIKSEIEFQQRLEEREIERKKREEHESIYYTINKNKNR